MPSLQGRVLRSLLKRAHIFGKPGDSLEDMRNSMEKFARRARPPKLVEVRPVRIGDRPAEWLIPPLELRDDHPESAGRALLYFHGGAFVLGSLSTHRALAARLALACNAPVLNLDYRLAPEYSFPAALQDCQGAFLWLVEHGIAPHQIILGGDSAGGNLALATLLALRETGSPLPGGAFCFSPVTDLAGTGDSMHTKAADDPILRFEHPSELVLGYIGQNDPCNPLLSPYYGDLHGLPPLLLHVGEVEILLDDSTRFVDRAQAAGVDAQVVVWPGMWHVFQVFAPLVPEANQSIDQIANFCRNIQSLA